jgi:hypothetical protein
VRCLGHPHSVGRERIVRFLNGYVRGAILHRTRPGSAKKFELLLWRRHRLVGRTPRISSRSSKSPRTIVFSQALLKSRRDAGYKPAPQSRESSLRANALQTLAAGFASRRFLCCGLARGCFFCNRTTFSASGCRFLGLFRARRRFATAL